MPCYHQPPCPSCTEALAYCGTPLSSSYTYHWRSDDATSQRQEGQVVFSLDNVKYQDGEWVVRGKRFVPLCLTQVCEYYRHKPPFDRHLYESLRSGIPYKPILDLDRALVDDEATVSSLHAVYVAKFLPIVVAFYTAEFGVPVEVTDLCSMDASLEGKKFSKHLVVSAHAGGGVIAYVDRADEIHIMHRFREAVERQAEHDPVLADFYYFDDDQGERCTVVDYAIYHHGKRDMRLVGSCKAAGKHPDKALRTLVPDDWSRPICDYMCNTFGAAVRPVAVTGASSAPPPPKQRRTKRKRSVTTTTSGDDSTAAYTGRLADPMRALVRLAGGGGVARVTCGADGQLCAPVNYGKSADGVRRCLLMVRHSRHWAQIAYKPKGHCIDYYCHGCGVSVQLSSSTTTTQQRDGRQDASARALAAKAAAAGIEYERLGTRFLPPLAMHSPGKQTVVLRSGMGSGKTCRIAEYLEKLPPELSILCIGYRRVLNSALAEKFGLVDYQQACGDLSKTRRLCVQVDSLPRLLAKRKCDSWKLRSVFDVVVVDEVESTLDHFASSTLESKVLVCWKLFSIIVQRATKVIMADADAADRTLAVVASLRSPQTEEKGVQETRLIDNDNHNKDAGDGDGMCNCFVWLPSLTAFVGRAADFLGQGRRVYLASNSRVFAHTFKALVVAAVARIPGGRRLEESDVLLIDRNVSEAQKRLVCECNSTWLVYRLVICTPTVGAGIDFHVRNHFHATFVYATDRSTTPREVNQQRGRVRHPVDKRCYLLVDTHHTVPLTEDVPKLERKLEQRCKAVVTDLVLQQQESGSRDWLGVSLSKTPPLLLRLLAIHEAEVNSSRNNMRAVLHKLLQEKYPTARHVVLTAGPSDSGMLRRQHAEAIRYKIAQAEELALQPPLLPDEISALTTMVITGSDEDEPLAKQRLHMQAIRDFYPGHHGEWAVTDILGIGSDVFRKRVEYATCLLSSSSTTTTEWTPLTVHGAAAFTLAHRTALELREPAQVQQALFALLVFFAGLQDASPQHIVSTIIACFLPSARFHSALAHERIELNPEKYALVSDRFGVTAAEETPKGKRRALRAALRRHLSSALGIQLVSTGCHKHARGLRHGATSSCDRVRLANTDVAGLMAAVQAHANDTPAGVVAGALAILHVYATPQPPHLPHAYAHRGIGISERPAIRARKSINRAAPDEEEAGAVAARRRREAAAFQHAASELTRILQATADDE